MEQMFTWMFYNFNHMFSLTWIQKREDLHPCLHLHCGELEIEVIRGIQGSTYLRLNSYLIFYL